MSQIDRRQTLAWLAASALPSAAVAQPASAAAVDGIDVIVGGHSQNPVCMLAVNVRNDAYQPGQPCAPDRQNGAWIVQAHEWGKYVGRADFEYRNGELRLLKYQLLPVNLKQTVKRADGSSQKVPYTAEIAEIKEKMYSAGAYYAAMSGSGSSVFGLFDYQPSEIEFSDESCL